MNAWLIPNILLLSHDLAVAGVVAAPVIVVVLTMTQPADPTWRIDVGRTAIDPTWRTDAGRTVLRHDPGDTRRAPSPPATHARRLSAPRTSRASDASDEPDSTRRSPRAASASAMAATSDKRRKHVAELEHGLEHHGDIRLLPTSTACSYARPRSRRARCVQCAPITRTGRAWLASTFYCPGPPRPQP